MAVDFGTDINLVTDLAPVWGLASGLANLANALLRRLITPRGTLFYDLDYGYDVMSQLNSALGPTDVTRIRAAIASEMRKDPRVKSATVDLQFTQATRTLQITLTIQTAAGPFTLVIAATNLTLDLLTVNGVPLAA